MFLSPRGSASATGTKPVKSKISLAPVDQSAAPAGPIPVITPDPRETVWSQFPPLKRARRYLRSFLYRFPDTGLLGLTPLRTHILVCGYQRAGTTLLLAMLEHALPAARRFGHEISGWRAATHARRNHAVLISKVPNDLLTLHTVRKFYANRKAQLKPIILVRDPRDVLTSRITALDSSRYATDPRQWIQYHAHYRLYKNDPTVLCLRYEDLVADPDAIQRRIDAFTNEPGQHPFSSFHKTPRPDFDTTPLNGVRPVDSDTVGRWSSPEHAARITQLLRDIPDFPEVLTELGYEPDSSWIQRWQSSVGL